MIKYMKRHKQQGSLTMEYILLTLFGAMTALASVTYLSKTIHQQIQKMESQLETSFEESSTPSSWNQPK